MQVFFLSSFYLFWFFLFLRKDSNLKIFINFTEKIRHSYARSTLKESIEER